MFIVLGNDDRLYSGLRKSCRYPAKYMLSLFTDFVHNFIVIHLLKIAIFLDVEISAGNTGKISAKSVQTLFDSSFLLNKVDRHCYL